MYLYIITLYEKDFHKFIFSKYQFIDIQDFM